MFWFSCFLQFEISWLLVWQTTFSLSGFFVYYVMKPWILFKSSLLADFLWCCFCKGGGGIASLLPGGKKSRFPTWPPLTPGDRDPGYWRAGTGVLDPRRSPLIPPCISSSTWCVELTNDRSVWVFTATRNGKSNRMIWSIRIFVKMSIRILGLNSLRVSLAAQ